MTPSADTARLVHALERFRRRLRLVLAWRAGVTSFGMAILAAEALWWLVGLGGARAAWLIVGTIAAAGAVTTLVAVTRTPSLAETARLIDRRAALQNRAASALQFAEQDDAMAVLLVQDTAARLVTLDAAAAFPREYPSHARLLIGMVTAGSVAFATLAFLERASQGGGRRAGGTVVSAGSVAARGMGTPRAAGEPSAGASAQATPTTSSAGTHELSREQPNEARGPSGDTSVPGRSDTAGPSRSSQQRTDDRAQRRGSAADAVAPGTGAGGEADARGTTASASPRAEHMTASSRYGAAGAGMATRSAPAGGGVKAGATGSDSPDLRRTRTGDGPGQYQAAYQAAWARAQAAMTQDRVPPELRDYVRRYFEAIRSRKQQ
jgi:hypothetical protein